MVSELAGRHFHSMCNWTTVSRDCTDGTQQLDSGHAVTDWPLVCPDCQAPLCYDNNTYNCLHCGKGYPVKDGVVCFVGQDAFYEERYPPMPLNFQPDERLPWELALLYLVSMHYLWYIRKYVPHMSRILDVACGAGMRYLPTLGSVAGLEVSFSSARQMAQVYDLSLQANALKIPLAGGAVDAIVSRFFLEHVPTKDKMLLLSEFRRVLKPGGWLVTLQDCDCNNPLWRWAKQDPNLFQKHFIENDGHYGLVCPSENIALFRKAGFEIITYRASNKTPLVHLSMFQWMMPYRGKSRLVDAMLMLASVAHRSRWLGQAFTMAVTLIDDLMEPYLPLDHARYLLAVCRVNSHRDV